MTYSVGGKIEASDYNNLATSANAVWSNGSGDSGYGQTQISPVVIGDKILASQWAALVNTINNTGRHQNSAFSVLPVPVIANLITFQNLGSQISNLTGTRLNAAAVGTDIINSATRTTQWGSATGEPVVSSTITVTFANANAIRYFFNAGGTIRLSISRSGGSGTPQNTAWTQLCTDVGTLALPAVNTAQTIAGTAFSGLTRIGGGGSGPDIYTRNGFYQLSGTPALLYRQYSDQGVYTSDNVQISYSQNGSGVITISVVFTDTNSGGTADIVDGSLTVTALARPPSTNYLTNTWGTPVVAVSAPA